MPPADYSLVHDVARLGTKDRVRTAAGGVAPAAVGVPLLLNDWSPVWFALGWAVAYLVASCTFMALVWKRGSSPRLELVWAIAVALCFAALPVSAVIWNDGRAFWIAGMICMIYTAFELAYLPFIDIEEWRAGIAIVGVALVTCGLFVMHPVIALSLAPLLVVMVATAERLRTARSALDNQLQKTESELGQDPLTGLLNRRGIAEVLAARSDQPSSLLLIDLDDFKRVNDSRGYSVGDQVLIDIGAELSARLGSSWQLGRQGGDEFVASRLGVEDDFAALEARLHEPFHCSVENHGFTDQLEVRLSAGIVHAPNGAPADDLMGKATYALRSSKQADRTLTVFGDQLEERFARAREIASMNIANDVGGTFVAHGQPIHGANGAIGCELLVRWQTEEGELLAPGDFLTMAAETGTLPLLHRVMLRAGVEFAARFNGLPSAPFVSVNVSASHLAAEDLLSELRTWLTTHDVEPSRMMIEITESERLADLDHGTIVMDQLRQLGVQLAIDDFGTGYSGIERLQSLPITHLKFDRSMLSKADGPLGEILRGVARFGARSGIAIIAEGIETTDELASMRSLGVSAFQGFLFGRPMSLDALERELLRYQISGPQRSAPEAGRSLRVVESPEQAKNAR